jgi:hypothetical protein
VARADFRQYVRCTCATLTFAVVVLFASVASASGDPGLVPISWALDVSNGKASNVAVAVPWSFSYSRLSSVKELALFRFFPHMALLGSGDAKTATLTRNPHFAMGCGVGLANALAFGVGVQVDDPFSHAYIMAGLSLTDFAKLVLRL